MLKSTGHRNVLQDIPQLLRGLPVPYLVFGNDLDILRLSGRPSAHRAECGSRQKEEARAHEDERRHVSDQLTLGPQGTPESGTGAVL